MIELTPDRVRVLLKTLSNWHFWRAGELIDDDDRLAAELEAELEAMMDGKDEGSCGGCGHGVHVGRKCDGWVPVNGGKMGCQCWVEKRGRAGGAVVRIEVQVDGLKGVDGEKSLVERVLRERVADGGIVDAKVVGVEW